MLTAELLGVSTMFRDTLSQWGLPTLACGACFLLGFGFRHSAHNDLLTANRLEILRPDGSIAITLSATDANESINIQNSDATASVTAGIKSGDAIITASSQSDTARASIMASGSDASINVSSIAGVAGSLSATTQQSNINLTDGMSAVLAGTMPDDEPTVTIRDRSGGIHELLELPVH